MKHIARACFLTLVITLSLLLVVLTVPATMHATATTSAIHNVVTDNTNPECLGSDCGAPTEVGLSTFHGIVDNNNPECLGTSCGTPSQEGGNGTA